MAVETVDELYGVIARLVKDASGYETARLADQGRSPPAGPYFTYKPIPVRAYGQPRRVREDIPAAEPVPTFTWTDMQETLITSLEMMVSINFFDSGAQNAALRMQQAQFRQPISDYCFANGIAWRYVSESRNLTGVEMGDIQERYQIDLHLWIETQVTDIILRAAGFSLTIEDEDGNTLNELETTTAGA